MSLERLFADSAVEPPKVSVSLQGAIEALTVPVSWITAKIAEARERAIVTVIYNEV